MLRWKTVLGRRAAGGRSRGFGGDESGATAVEFGMVAMPFFAIMFAIIETALTFWSGQILDTIVNDASRRVYTGQFQTDNKGVTDTATLISNFRKEMCGEGTKKRTTLFDCAKVELDVRTFDSFPSKQADPPITNGEYDKTKFGAFQSLAPDKIVVIRAYVEHPVYVSLMNPNQANLKNGKRVLMATATFKTEPY